MTIQVQPRMLIGFFCIVVIMAAGACAPSPAAGTEGSAEPPPTFTFPPAFPGTPTNTKFPTRTKPIVRTDTPTPTPIGLSLDDALPQGAKARLGRGIINQIAVSPDGETIAVAAGTGLFLYRKNDFSAVWSVAFAKSISDVVFSADGGTIAAAVRCIFYPHYAMNGGMGPMCSDQVEILIFRAADGFLINRFAPYAGDHTFGGSHLQGMALSPDGFTLYLVTMFEPVTVWDAQSGQKLRSYSIAEKNSPRYDAIAFSADGIRLGVVADGLIRILDLQTGEMIRTFTAYEGDYSADGLALSMDGSKLAVDFDSKTTVWNVQDSRPTLSLEEPLGGVGRLVFSPDAKVLLRVDYRGTIIQWDAVTGHTLRVYPESDGQYDYISFGRIDPVSFSPDGRTFFVGTESRLIGYNSVSGQSLTIPPLPFSFWEDLYFPPDGRDIILQGNAILSRFSRETFESTGNTAFPNGAVLSDDFSVFAKVDGDGRIVISEVAGGVRLSSFQAPDYLSHRGAVPVISNYDFVFSPDGKTAATVANNMDVAMDCADLWDLSDGRLLRRLQGHGASAFDSSRLVFSGDSGTAAIGVFDGIGEFGEAIAVFRTANGEPLLIFGTFLEHVFALSADGDWLVTGCDYGQGGVVCVDNVRDYNDFYPHSYGGISSGDRITSVTFSPDGSLIAAGTIWGAVLVWETKADRLLDVFQGHPMSVSTLQFSPDTKTLASVGEEGTVVLWELRG
jgi:WD40 repeat protein